MATEQKDIQLGQWVVHEQRLHTPLFQFIEPDNLKLPKVMEGQFEPPKTTAIALLDQAAETNWGDLEHDPIVDKLKKLSPILLMSISAGDDRIGAWTSLALQKRYYGQLSDSDQTKVNEQVDFIQLLGKKPKGEWGGMERSIERMLSSGKSKISYLVAPEIFEQNGINIHADIFDPMRALELSLGYNPRGTSLQSRIDGMAIPKPLRALIGQLRFFQRGRANGDLMDEYIALLHTVSAQQAQAVEILNRSFGKQFGMDLPFQKNAISNDDRFPDVSEVAHWLYSDPCPSVLRQILQTDYGRDILDDYPSKSPREIGDRINTLVVGCVDPGLAESALTYRTLESFQSNPLNIPGLNYYHFSQTFSVMRQFGFRDN